LKGELKVEPITDDAERFRRLQFIFIQKDSAYQKVDVEGVRIAGRFIRLKLRECDKREDAERLKGKYIYIDRPNAAEIEKSSYYYYDIVGCEVRRLDGGLVGIITDIQNAGSCDVYVVSSEREEYFIPAVKDVVKEININRKEIIIDVIDGLF